MHYFVSILVCNQLEEEKKADCFAIIVLQMFCYYKCSVAFPYGAVDVIVVFPDHTLICKIIG